MRVRLSAQAEADLRSIARWIGSDDPERARSFAAQLRRSCQGLSRSPRRDPVAGVIGGDQLRKRTHRNYLILYIILEDAVEVARIVHSARDWVTMIAPEVTTAAGPNE